MTQRVPVAVASAAVSLHRLSTSILATTAVSITGSSDTIFRSEPAARNIITYVVHGKVGRSKKNKANGWLTELTEFMGNPNGEHDSRMSTFGSRINSAYRQILTVGARSNSKDKDNDYAYYSTHTVLNKE